MKSLAIIIDEKDNVATALKDLKKGEKVKVSIDNVSVELKITEDIPVFHKFMLYNIGLGQKVFKYGQVIGETVFDIKAGELVHIHNIKSLRGS